MQASVVSSCSVLSLTTEPVHQNEFYEVEVENNYGDSTESVETLHKMPVGQHYLRELEFRLAKSNFTSCVEIPVAESNRLVMEVIIQPSQQSSINAFTFATSFCAIVIDDNSSSARKTWNHANVECERSLEVDKQPEYCHKLRQLFRQADTKRQTNRNAAANVNRNLSRTKPLSAFERLERAVEWNNADKTEVMTFKQWFIAGPAWMPGMHVVLPKNR